MASGMYPHQMGTVAAERILFNTEGTSRKQYQVTLAEAPEGGWMVIGSWGPIGRVTQHKVYARSEDAVAAVSAANALMHSKLTRGYAYDPTGPTRHITVSEVVAERLAEAVQTLEERPAESLADALFA